MGSPTKKIIVGVVVVLISALVIYIILAQLYAPSCKLTANLPSDDLIKIGHSSTNDAVAVISAYLKYDIKNGSSDKEVFMPLEFHTFNKKSDANRTILELEADCAKFELQLVKKADKIETDKIEIELKTPNGEFNSCAVDKPKIEWMKDTHYRCKGQERKCYQASKDKDGLLRSEFVATVMFNNLEFEIDGDAENVKNDKFSTKPYCP